MTDEQYDLESFRSHCREEGLDYTAQNRPLLHPSLEAARLRYLAARKEFANLLGVEE